MKMALPELMKKQLIKSYAGRKLP